MLIDFVVMNTSYYNPLTLILGQSPRYIVMIEQISAVLPRFSPRFAQFAAFLFIPTVLEIFYQDIASLQPFWSFLQYQKYFTKIQPVCNLFGHSYCTRNILIRFSQFATILSFLQYQKYFTKIWPLCNLFGHSFNTRNIMLHQPRGF